MKSNCQIHVLYVNDDRSFANVFKRILQAQGIFTIQNARSVDEALRKLESGSFDVVVSDYYMPNLTGLDLLRTIRENASDIPFTFFIGKNQEEIVVNALNLGADRYIDKSGEPEAVYPELAFSIRQLH